MKIISFCTIVLTFLITTFCSSKTHANSANKELSNNVSTYISSESFSNILPIKQLIKDDWQQAPASDSSNGFTQNELGIKAYWGNVSFNIAHRFDYFVFTNPDTAQVFYLDRKNKPITSQDSYQLSLQLHHQRSNGFRVGYQWQLDNFSTEVNIGYWDVKATRNSQITGEIFGDENNNITGEAELTEYYSDNNFLKRENNESWKTDGYGITVDIAMAWQITEQLLIDAQIKDLYSTYKLKGLGYSRGNVDTEGTFINALGGKSYLPLYRGVAGYKDYQFDLPEQVNLIANYQAESLSNDNYTLGYIARYKRQGEINFYYAGLELALENSALTIMLDLENLSPELKYTNQWFEMVFATDRFDLDKAMQFSLGVSVNYAF